MQKLLLTLFLSVCALVGKSQASGWINFEFYHGNQIYVPVSVNGGQGVALLVTSVGRTMMDKTFATSIGIHGVADTAIVDIQLGQLTLKHVKVNITPSRPTTHPRNLVLSDDLFNAVAVDIDFAHDRLACYPSTGFTKPIGAVALPLIPTADSRSVPVSVGTAAPMPFEVFLGDPAPLTVYEAYEKSNGLLSNGPRSVRLDGGGGAHPREAVATLSLVHFADVEFNQVPGIFPTDSVRGSTSTLVSGNIGMAILSRFRLLFDYAHDRLYATPYDSTSIAPFVKDRSGLFLNTNNGHYIVEFVAPQSPAEKAGFLTGDSVGLIDQQPVQVFQGQAWQAAALGSLRPIAAGTTFVFTLENGSIRQLTTADYF